MLGLESANFFVVQAFQLRRKAASRKEIDAADDCVADVSCLARWSEQDMQIVRVVSIHHKVILHSEWSRGWASAAQFVATSDSVVQQ